MVLMFVAVLKTHAQAPHSAGSGFADELDVQYGEVDQDPLSGEVMKQLIKFQDGGEFELPKMGQTIDLGEDKSEQTLPNASPELGEDSRSPVERRSLGTHLRAVGSFTIVDWISNLDVEADPLDEIKQRAMEYAEMTEPSLLEIGESKEKPPDALAIAEANALASQQFEQEPELGASVERKRISDADRERPRRPGWQRPVPGITLKLATAGILTQTGRDAAEDPLERFVSVAKPGQSGKQQHLLDMDVKERFKLLLTLPVERRGAMLQTLTNKEIVEILAATPNEKLNDLVQSMRLKHKAEVLQAMNGAMRDRTLRAMPLHQRAAVLALMPKDDQKPYMLTGCYADSHTRVLPVSAGDGNGESREQPNSMNPAKCAALCVGYKMDYTLMALQTMNLQTFCYCGKSVGSHSKVPSKHCQTPCAGAPELKCGATMHASVFMLDLEAKGESCWTGKEYIKGLDPSKPWERYRGCSICDGSRTQEGGNTENWQMWGEPVKTRKYAECLACKPLDALVVTDPKRGTGFCTSYNPEIEKVVSHTYPYYAHFDGSSDFSHTKFVQTVVSPNMRSGKAFASCKLWKQITCAPNKEALQKAWAQYRGQTSDSDGIPQHRYLQCQTVKTIQCTKVCLKAKLRNKCGRGGNYVQAYSPHGLKSVLGTGSSEQAGNWCCYNDCQIPPSKSFYKEDGSFWCKNAAMTL